MGAFAVPFLFALTMFVSATLLFLVQPMIGKMVLPLLGGTPAVWNTCMVFYQALLLAGYYYAHKSTSSFDAKKQTTLHTLLLFGALGALAVAAILTVDHSPIPVLKSISPQGDDYPFFGVIVLLMVAIALPFFVVSTSAPLLQKWFGETGHRSAKDPYFLYAASNFGSLLALVAYPAVVEPNLKLLHQAWLWAIGYAILVGLVLLCAKAVRKGAPPIENVQPTRAKTALGLPPAIDHAPTVLRQLRWLGLAFVPSSLMLGVTTFFSTDMASIPLLWIIPLSLYLLTFIIVFAKVPKQLHLLMTLLMPVMVLLLVFVMTSHVKTKFSWLILLHMSTFFVVAMVCHGELAHDRPSPRWLTKFYLLMSLGGMLGGLFNALVAPIVFTFTSEYPITLVLGCLLLPAMFPERVRGGWTLFLDFLLPMAVFGLCRLVQSNDQQLSSYVFSQGRYIMASIVLFAIPAAGAVFLKEKDLRFRIALGILLASSIAFYGVLDPLLFLAQRFAEPDLAQWLEPSLWRWASVVVLFIAYVVYWRKRTDPDTTLKYAVHGLAALVICFAVMLAGAQWITDEVTRDMAQRVKISEEIVRQILIFGVPAMICYFFVERPVRFGLAIAALWLATFVTEYRAEHKSDVSERYQVYYDRSFYGRLKIERYGRWERISTDLVPDEILSDRDTYKVKVETFDPDTQSKTYSLRKNDALAYQIDTSVEKGEPRASFYKRREYVQLVHGTTVHGLQEADKLSSDIPKALLPAATMNWLGDLLLEHRFGSEIQRIKAFPGREPLTYYHRTGPVGAMFKVFEDRNANNNSANTSVGCIGLGTGTLSAYGKPGQSIVFFEIDTHVRRLVEGPKYFTYIDQAKAQNVKVEFIMGDARISLERLDRKFGMIFVDAFSSDAIPAHLLTKQAVELYFQRLEDDGLLGVHISNRYLDLEPVVERICRELNLEARIMHGQMYESDKDPVTDVGKYASSWIAVARTKEALRAIERDTQAWLQEEKISYSDRWIPLNRRDDIGLWTDDFSPIIPILRGEWRFWDRDDR